MLDTMLGRNGCSDGVLQWRVALGAAAATGGADTGCGDGEVHLDQDLESKRGNTRNGHNRKTVLTDSG